MQISLAEAWAAHTVPSHPAGSFGFCAVRVIIQGQADGHGMLNQVIINLVLVIPHLSYLTKADLPQCLTFKGMQAASQQQKTMLGEHLENRHV